MIGCSESRMIVLAAARGTCSRHGSGEGVQGHAISRSLVRRQGVFLWHPVLNRGPERYPPPHGSLPWSWLSSASGTPRLRPPRCCCCCCHPGRQCCRSRSNPRRTPWGCAVHPRLRRLTVFIAPLQYSLHQFHVTFRKPSRSGAVSVRRVDSLEQYKRRKLPTNVARLGRAGDESNRP